jgi:hypothetical protein
MIIIDNIYRLSIIYIYIIYQHHVPLRQITVRRFQLPRSVSKAEADCFNRLWNPASRRKTIIIKVQGGAPSYKLDYNPINYRYITYKPQLLEL